MDHNERSMDPRQGWSGVRGGDSSEEHSQGAEETQRDHCDHDNSGVELQDGFQHVTHEGASGGSSGTEIRSMEELCNAIKLGNLSQVESINLDGQHIGSEHFTLAEALASGQMSTLEELWLRNTGLDNDRTEAIGNALTSGTFPSLTTIHVGANKIGTKGVEALGLAIRSGNLEKLESLNLWKTGITDDDMTTLASAFQHGEASVLPNLSILSLSSNPFTEAGLQTMAEALKSGRLDSLERLGLSESPNPSREGATALVSAFVLNSRLVAEVGFQWFLFPDLDRQLEQQRRRNYIRYKEIMAGLSGSFMVPAAIGKIYLCGDPEVGKTTLCHTLQRTFRQSLWTWETRPRVETRTRGIDVSQISSKGSKRKDENPITLSVWDMAGQQDYHLVHNAFFPALSFSEGKATTFVIVCNSEHPDKARQQIEYWLRYIASSCHEAAKKIRHVFVVLNNIGGDKTVQENCQGWEMLLEDKRDKFSGFLDVHTDPFVLDVRRRGEVNSLRTCLLEHSRKVLKEEKVPKICDIIQRNLPSWSEARKEFPVLDWEEFVLEVEQLREDWPPQIILSATKYLSEAGVLIYVDKSFPVQWGIPSQKLIILDPNWFCKEIIGNLFLSDDMVDHRERTNLFREKVDAVTGSIAMSDFQRFFRSRWSAKNCQNLIAILVWLGLCYKGKEDNVFIPSLIDKNGKPGAKWQLQGEYEDGDHRWVMGFSVEHRKSEMTLAPMSLWHRFQVQLAQTPRFNTEVLDSDFAAGKYFITFAVDYMNVLIEVDATEDIPTFHEISIFVKPQFKKEELSTHERKQRQVDLANHLVDILLELWHDICGGVQYVRKVVWPWPSSHSRPKYILDRNVEVAQVTRLVQMHGMGRKMQWTVGNDSAITEDQLLSTNDKRYVIESAESDLSILREGVKEAVNLRIYPPQLTEDLVFSLDGIDVAVHLTNVSTEGVSVEKSRAASYGFQEATKPMSPTCRILKAVKEVQYDVRDVGDKVDEVFKKLNNVENMLREGFSKVLKEQKKVLRELQDTARFFKEDRDRTCPNLIYLGEKDSGVWATLKQALSPSVYVRLRFACEAKFNNYRPHEVTDQQGLDISAWRPFLKKIAPWLQVSLTVLLISAKIGANFVAPGMGLIFPNFQQWQQAQSLLEGIEWASGFPKAELDQLMMEGMGLDANHALWDPRDIYGKSREAISNLIGNLTPEEYEQKFGLRKVCLRYSDGSLHGVVWICTECLRNFRESDLVSEV